MRHKARDSGVKFALLLLLCHHISLLPGKRLTRICYVIGFQIIRIHPFTRYRIRGRFFFSILESGFKNIRIRCRICRMRVDGSRIRKSCGFENIRIRVDGASVHHQV